MGRVMRSNDLIFQTLEKKQCVYILDKFPTDDINEIIFSSKWLIDKLR